MRSWPALDVEPGPADWDLIQAALTEFEVAAIDDTSSARPRVFFSTPDVRDRAAAALRERFAGSTCAPVDVPDEDWAARSQANLKAIRVGRIVVAPPWDVGRDAAASAGDALTIVIQPSMGFGTGHHATTRLCLDHLQHLPLRNRTAVDLGAGSGVLAIAASRLGATHVLALDDDPDAIQSARENLELNPGAEVTLGVVDLRRARLRPFDVVLANLTGGLLVAAAQSIEGLSIRGGHLILSGFMAHEERDVLAAFTAFTIDRRSQEDEWVCVTLSRAA